MKTKTCILKKKLEQINEQGYLTLPLLECPWNKFKQSFHYKEYYNYYINHKSFALVLRVSKHWGCLQINLSFMDYLADTLVKKQVTVPLPPSLRMDSPTQWHYSYKDQQLQLGIRPDKLYLSIKNFTDGSLLNPGETFKAAFHFRVDNPSHTLTHDNDGEYHNHNTLQLGVPSSGYAYLGTLHYRFTLAETHATMEYNYGTFPADFHSSRSIAQGSIAGNSFAFHICHGCKRSISYENTFLYDHEKSKLGRTSIHFEPSDENKTLDDIPCETQVIKENDYMSRWQISSPCCCFGLDFEPLYDVSPIDTLWFSNHYHQIIGKYTGWIILDDGSVIFVNDYYGLAEYVE